MLCPSFECTDVRFAFPRCLSEVRELKATTRDQVSLFSLCSIKMPQRQFCNEKLQNRCVSTASNKLPWNFESIVPIEDVH